MQSQIRDIQLAPSGQAKINWVKNHMPILNQLEKEFSASQPFAGKKVAICLHLEAKTAYLALVVKAGGAEVAVAASNPLSTQDDVVAALVENGITAFAWHGASEEEYFTHLNLLADFHPDLFIDDGGDLTHLLHSTRPDDLKTILGGCEETTTGIIRLRSMAREGALKVPMIAVNDALSKYFFDNRYGTGQSAWDAIMRTTNLVVAGKTAVVAGYGWCGKGVAMRAKGLGAKVIVCEVDPIKAIEAVMDGFQVMKMVDAAPLGDFFITVTGDKNVITEEHFRVMNNKAILANAGHFDVEIDKEALARLAVSSGPTKPNIEEFHFADGRVVYLLGEGRLVNLAAGDGHPAEIMDLTFALQALSLVHILEHPELSNAVHTVPKSIDQRVSALKLAALGLTIDELSAEQVQYLNSWQI